VTRLQRLYEDHGQSPWLDNLTRPYLRNETLIRLIDDGIRGVTSNPTIFAKAVEASAAYDAHFRSLIAEGRSVVDAYWELAVADTVDALAMLRSTFDDSGGSDGFVSIEVAPELAHHSETTVAAARDLHQRIARPNLLVKIPATPEGVLAIETMIAQGRSINVTLIFSLSRYAQVIEAYLSGLEAVVESGGEPGQVHSVASFFVSRVDTEVDRRLDGVGTDQARGLRGRAAIAQAKLAYQLFAECFSGPRWDRLAALGANVQRPLWASTSTKDPSYSDTRYVDDLIGPHTVNTLPEATIAAFENHGTLDRRIDTGLDEAQDALERMAAIGIDMVDVGQTLEDKGVATFHESFAGVLKTLDSKAQQLASH
jgi:transaldolase